MFVSTADWCLGKKKKSTAPLAGGGKYQPGGNLLCENASIPLVPALKLGTAAVLVTEPSVGQQLGISL